MSNADKNQTGNSEMEQNPVGFKSNSWHRPPLITPNFGKRKKIGPKTSLTQVLLHDNVSQEKILQAQLRSLNREEKRSGKLLDLHRKSFVVRQTIKQQRLLDSGLTHVSFLPECLNQHNASRLSQPQKPDQNKPTQEKTNDETDSDAGTRVSSTASLPKLVEDLGDITPLPIVANNNTRSYSAVQPKMANNFMTHNYALRREKTVTAAGHGSNERRNMTRLKSPLRALKDPRFISLKNTLVPCSRPVDAYLQLSPSGQYVLRKYGQPSVDQDNVHRMIRDITMYTPRNRGMRVITVVEGDTTHEEHGATKSTRPADNHISFAENQGESDEDY